MNEVKDLEARPSKIIQAGNQHLRIAPWRSNPNAAQLTPLCAFEVLEPAAVSAGVAKARALGYEVIFTSALADRETLPFLINGFTLKEQLYVLRHDMSEPILSTHPEIKMRKPTTDDLHEVVGIDSLCFDSFWTLNQEGLFEAENATSRARFRVASVALAKRQSKAVAYAITGIGERKGYLQRLAVHPDFQGQGIAQQLVADGMKWLRLWRSRELYVNTQVTNQRALDFYLKMNFELLDERLNVLASPT